ncbi:MAG: MATE family efflux transporter [Thermoplasmata archaeon]|nr:MATE family efflux transporter [Thermoplasmata archaeon]
MTRIRRQGKVNLVEWDIKKVLIRLSLPMMTGFIAIMIFNTTDMIYVGMLGGDELAAISFTFPIAMLFAAIGQGLGVGVSSVVARDIGAGNIEAGKRVTTHTLLLSLMISIAISVIGILTIDQVFGIMGAKSEIRPLIRDYMEIWYIGIIFVMVPMTGNNVIRATGDAKTPMYIMLTAALLNIVLDPLIIFGIGPFPALELRGAAIATVISRGTTMVVTLYVLYHREHLIDLRIPSMESLRASWCSVLHVGGPAAITKLLAPVSLGVLTYLSSLHGKEAVAAFGVGSRVDILATLPIFGLSASLIPFVGQNTGAGKIERIRRAVRMSIRFSFIWGFGAALVLMLLSDQIGVIFTRNDTILERLRLYFVIVPVSYAFQGVINLSAGYFNGSGRPLPAAILNICRFLVLLVPLAFAGNYLLGFRGILGGFALAGILTGILAILLVRNALSQEPRVSFI